MIGNYSFETKEVSWSVDDIVVSGTMTRPNTKEATGVVFVAGSGPVDRNWCSPLLPGTNGSARLLAEALSRQGYATLRYDKRASGPHASENVPKMLGKISMQSHVDELKGAFEAMANTSGLEPANIFALTSSEGAVHALNYQLQSIGKQKFKGLILTGAPGRSLNQVVKSQARALLSSHPDRDALMKHYDDAISAFLQGKRITPDPSLPGELKNLLIGLDSPVNLPFTRELWSYSLSDAIAKVSEPIIVIIGKKDIQIAWDIDGKALEIASAMKGNVTFVYPENADHTLKHEERPREKLTVQEVVLRYNAEERKLDQETLLAIVNWLDEHQV